MSLSAPVARNGGDRVQVVPVIAPAHRRRPASFLRGIWPRREPSAPEVGVGGRARRERLLEQLEPVVPDLVAAVRNRWVSFVELIDAHEGREAKAQSRDQQQLKRAYVQIYPLVRQTFVEAHGELVDMYPSPRMNAYAALTKPVRTRRPFKNDPKPDFHFVYDLTSAPVAGQLFSRISQLAYDAKRIVPSRRLAECLEQLYSATTDLLRLLEEHSKHTDHARELDKITVIKGDLDQVELRYLQITARLWYFLGVLGGTGLAMFGAFAIGTAAKLSSVDIAAVMFSAVGATLSVVQKISDDSLTVRYVVGPFYLCFLGIVRPVIGAFAGFLLQLAMVAGLIPLSLSGFAGQSYILLAGFAVGWAERSIPDIFSRSGFSGGLPAAAGQAGQAVNSARDYQAAVKRRTAILKKTGGTRTRRALDKQGRR